MILPYLTKQVRIKRKEKLCSHVYRSLYIFYIYRILTEQRIFILQLITCRHHWATNSLSEQTLAILSLLQCSYCMQAVGKSTEQP